MLKYRYQYSSISVASTSNSSHQLNQETDEFQTLQDLLEPPYDNISLNLSGGDKDSNDYEAEENPTVSFLKQWSIKNNITHTALSELLKWFSTSPAIHNLPKDARTLLATPSATSLVIEDMEPGQFYYFGLQSKLETFVISQPQVINVLILQFNIDGVQIYKSKNVAFWPILSFIKNSKHYVFPVAIYSGTKKPHLEEFFKKFVDELILLTNTGLVINNCNINIKIEAFCCDTPARSYIKNVKGHNAKYGCDKCTCEGIYQNGRRMLLNLDADLRTDESCLERHNEEHHKGPTPLSKLPIGLITNFPLDYMHSVCLGVMRKLLFLWRDGPRLIKLKNSDIATLNNTLEAASRMWPSDFNRKPRSLNELERWKATELRQFLLYLGPVLLKDLLPENLYCNFTLLHFGITILLNEDLNLAYNQYANSLLKLFVKEAVKIYGREFCTYNVHVLTHLANDAKQFNTLNNVNCFVFENYLGSLKKLLRKSNLPLQQVVRRLIEIDNSLSSSSFTANLKTGFVGRSTYNITEEIKYKFEGSFYSKYRFPTSVVSSKSGDNCIFLKSGEIIQVHCFINDASNTAKIIGKKFAIVQPFIEYPTNSSLLNLYEVALEDNQDFLIYSCQEFLCKGLVVQFNQVLVCMPLIH